MFYYYLQLLPKDILLLKIYWLGKVLKRLTAFFAVLLLASSVFNCLRVFSSFSSGLCQYLGDMEGCVDVSVYSAGIAITDGRVSGYPAEVLLAVTRGSGAVFIYAEPLVDETFILFAKVAAIVASAIVGTEFSKYNYFVQVRSLAARAQGPSLSAALGVGFALAILGVNVREPIAVTGILMPDGSIGPVGYLAEKIIALSSLVKKVFVPAGNLVSVVINGTAVSLVDFGRALGLEVVEVRGIDEVLKHLSAGSLLVKRYVEELSATNRVMAGLIDYLSEATRKGLTSVAITCGEDIAGKLALEFEHISSEVLGKQPVKSLAYILGQLISVLLRVETAVWNCSVGREHSALDALASRALERLKSAESFCYFYSRASGMSFRSTISLSTVCWFLLDSWEEFNSSVSSLSLERRVYGLVKSARVADSVIVALDLLSSELAGRVGRLEVDLRRVQLLLDYASAMVDSFGEVVVPNLWCNRSLGVLRQYLQVGANLLASNPVMSLVYVLKTLLELLLNTYYSQYADLQYITEISRARAAALAISTGDPAIYALVELGDSCVDSFEDPANCLSFYLKASVLGFVLRYLLVGEAEGSRTYAWHLLLAPVAAAVFLIVAVLLLRKGRVSFLRTLRYIGLQQLTQFRTRVVRR